MIDDTIFALSSGPPPAGIAVVRISGPHTEVVLRQLLGGRLPEPRRASLRTVRGGDAVIDRALILWLPGPATATGEDMAELHLHGGRAIVAAAERALGRMAGVRGAEPGEFTRRALYHGRIDLTAAEGLADLLAAIGVALVFGIADAAQIRLQSLYPSVPYQFFVIAPYVVALLSLAGASRNSRMPAFLGKPFRR